MSFITMMQWFVFITSTLLIAQPTSTSCFIIVVPTQQTRIRRQHYPLNVVAPKKDVSSTQQQVEQESNESTTTLPPVVATIQDEKVDAPASMVYYDNVIDDFDDDTNPIGGVVCARGVCVLAYDEDDEDSTVTTTASGSFSETANSVIKLKILDTSSFVPFRITIFQHFVQMYYEEEHLLLNI